MNVRTLYTAVAVIAGTLLVAVGAPSWRTSASKFRTSVQYARP